MCENFKFENVCQNSREILTLEVERAGEGPGPGRLTNAVSLAVIKTDCLYRSSLPGMLLSCETTPYSYLLYIYAFIHQYQYLIYSTPILFYSILLYSILFYSSLFYSI